MGGGGDGLSGCAQRHIELSDALAACIAAGKACDGVTRMPFVEMKHGLRCPGGAYHRLGKLPMAPYMGRMNAAQTWILLRGAEAKACDRIHSLRIATARPPPSPPFLHRRPLLNRRPHRHRRRRRHRHRLCCRMLLRTRCSSATPARKRSSAARPKRRSDRR